MNSELHMTSTEDFSIYKEELWDVDEILKQRKERFRITDSILEEIISADPHKTKKDVNDKETIKHVKYGNVTAKEHTINFKRRGVSIFNDASAKLHFHEGNVYEKYINSKPNQHPIYSLSEREFYQNIVKGLMKCKIKNQDILNHISQFLFHVMAVHSSIYLVEACYETLRYFLLHGSRTDPARPWFPTAEDVRLVFTNYGASQEILELNDIPIPSECTVKEKKCECLPDKPSKKNIYWVFKFLYFALLRNKENYSEEVLDQILMMFLIVSLDKYFLSAETYIYGLIANCCCKILDTYPPLDSREDVKISELGRMIYAKMRNVNAMNLYFVVDCCVTNTKLGHRLAQAICFSLIKDRVHFLRHVNHFHEVTAEDIKQMLSGCKLRELDYHAQYYILTILNCCIIKMIFTTNQQADLRSISNLLACLKINYPKEDDEPIDYYTLKELTTRMTTLWKLSIEEMK